MWGYNNVAGGALLFLNVPGPHMATKQVGYRLLDQLGIHFAIDPPDLGMPKRLHQAPFEMVLVGF